MIYNFLKHYFPEDKIGQGITPVAVDVLGPEYRLYLYDGGNLGWFVIAESDYLFVTAVPKDIEESFPVKVQGWRTLVDYQRKNGENLLSPDVFKDDRVNESDEDWEHYHAVVYKEAGATYFLFQVEPNEGIGLDSFGLTFYRHDDPGNKQ